MSDELHVPCSACGQAVMRRRGSTYACPACGATLADERELICDFCTAPVTDSAWDFPADDIDYGGPMIGPGATEPIEGSVGSWLACDECARLVTDGRRGRLARRAVDRLNDLAPEWVAIEGYVRTIVMARQMHDRFWRARRGPGVRIGVEQLALLRLDPPTVREWRPDAE